MGVGVTGAVGVLLGDEAVGVGLSTGLGMNSSVQKIFGRSWALKHAFI